MAALRIGSWPYSGRSPVNLPTGAGQAFPSVNHIIPGTGPQSAHSRAHILTHVPKSEIAEFRRWAVECVSLLTGVRVPETTICIQHKTCPQERHQVALQWIWFRYLNKGCNPTVQVRNCKTCQKERVCEVLKLRGSNEGVVRCRRRAGMSENIARKAQKTAGFRSAFDACDDENLFSGWEFHAYRQEQKNREYAAKTAEIEAALRFSLMRL